MLQNKFLKSLKRGVHPSISINYGKRLVKAFPQFPEFRKFVLDDRDIYQSFYSELEPYSDFSFNNLLVWLDINSDLEVSRLNGNLIFKFSDPFENNETSFTLIGNRKTYQTLGTIFQYQAGLGYQQKLSMVPQAVIDGIELGKQRHLDIQEDISNQDYIFNVNNAYYAKGKDFADLRHRINSFLKKYGDHLIYRDINLGKLEEQMNIINSLHTWDSVYALTENDKLRIEGLAIDRYLQLAPELDSRCVGLFINGRLQSFSLFHLPPQKGFAIGNHMKCNYEYQYIFDFTFYCTASRLKTMGIEWLNGEQDLGIAGLRTHKKELRPTYFLKRYTVQPLKQPSGH
ncbi:hypothetical protein A3B63_03450 [Candidatus Saccharibacteria bacterium RIFCSPLOWO2_01_FULL_49_22]|nr:MAG: hypothetical protein A3B63_03450 [Candidatus Saccharibacteria bacterium RIFCSPLOWO2_01_FULL_49_22]